MSESATQPESEAFTDIQPVLSEPVLEQEEPPAPRWRVSRSALLLIGGPLAGALLVWLAISIFRSNPATPPAPVAEQAPPAPAAESPQAITEPQAAMEPQSATESPPTNEFPQTMEPPPAAVEANAAEPAEPEPQSAPAPVDPQPRQQSQGAASAINEVLPKVSQSSLNTITGTVRVSVRVSINKEGSVVDAIAADPGPSRYFERLAIEAARKWTFAPANSADQRTMLLKFNFKREGVTAQAASDLTPQP